MIKCSLVEAYAFHRQLKESSQIIFPRHGMTKDGYLRYIPFTWTSCQNIGKTRNTFALIDMMRISALNFRADEYMEAVVGSSFADSPNKVAHIIHKVFD